MSSPTPGYDANNPQPNYPASGYTPAPAYSGGSAPAPSMGMPDAVRTVLTKYADFSGRARRSEFWWFYLAYVIVSIIASVIDQALGTIILALIVGLAALVPTLAVGARRLHDIGKSGWWQLIGIVPLIGLIVLIVFFATEGHPGANKWGPSPKFPAGSGY
jgi:uncharacterized membrane protein YhaH (DUF805 family)